jgi:hypothetical protein
MSTLTGNHSLNQLWSAWKHFMCSSFLGLAPLPYTRHPLPVNEAHKFPVSHLSLKHDSSLSESVCYVASGRGLLEPAEYLDQLRDSVVEVQMRVNTP